MAVAVTKSSRPSVFVFGPFHNLDNKVKFWKLFRLVLDAAKASSSGIGGRKGKTVTVRERLKRARPTVDSPTYRILKGQIDRKQYDELVNQERRRNGLPDIKRQAADGA